MRIRRKRRNRAWPACFWLFALAKGSRAAPETPIAPSVFQDAEKPSRTRKKPLQAAPAANRLESLDVRASKTDYAGGEPVFLSVTLLNKAVKPAAFLMLGPKLEFVVKRENKLVGLTYKAKDESKGDKVAYRSVPVGEKFEYSVVLSRLFDLSRAGNYTVSCSKYLKNDPREPGTDLVGPRIVAQSIKFSVSEADIAQKR